jgi:hypothetical protein
MFGLKHKFFKSTAQKSHIQYRTVTYRTEPNCTVPYRKATVLRTEAYSHTVLLLDNNDSDCDSQMFLLRRLHKQKTITSFRSLLGPSTTTTTIAKTRRKVNCSLVDVDIKRKYYDVFRF